MAQNNKKTSEKTSVPPHLPGEIRKIGMGDTSEQWYVLKTVGIAALVGLCSGFVAGIVVNSGFGEYVLWGARGKGNPYANVSQGQRNEISRETLAQQALMSVAGIYRASAALSRVAPSAEDRLGSAFFLTVDGYLAASAPGIRALHPKDMVVITADARVYAIEGMFEDPMSDVTILKIKGSNFTVLPFVYDDHADPGSFAWVVVPDEGLVSDEVSASSARIAKSGSPIASDSVYRAPLLKYAPPNASVGTPVMDYKGEVTGMVAAYKANRALWRAGIIKSALASVLQIHKIARPSLGAHFYEAGEVIAANLQGAPFDRGVMLANDPARRAGALDKKSPLAALGLKDGDYITALNDEQVSVVRSLPDILLDYQPGDRLTISYMQSGQEHTSSITLGTLSY